MQVNITPNSCISPVVSAFYGLQEIVRNSRCPNKHAVRDSLKEVNLIGCPFRWEFKELGGVSADKPFHLRRRKQATCEQLELSKRENPKLAARPVVKMHRLETQTCNPRFCGLPAVSSRVPISAPRGLVHQVKTSLNEKNYGLGNHHLFASIRLEASS